MEAQSDNVMSQVSRAVKPGRPGEFREGKVAKAIESRTAKLPSDAFLWLAGGAVVGSLATQIFGKRHTALFIGQWAPTLLILGLYNKMVKTIGHDSAGTESEI